MTTYEALEFLIENKSIDLKTATTAVFEAYQHNKIDGYEYDELVLLAADTAKYDTDN